MARSKASYGTAGVDNRQHRPHSQVDVRADVDLDGCTNPQDLEGVSRALAPASRHRPGHMHRSGGDAEAARVAAAAWVRVLPSDGGGRISTVPPGSLRESLAQDGPRELLRGHCHCVLSVR